MISITTLTPGDNDFLIIKKYKSKSKIQNASARISKKKTLDGGVVITHNGFAEGDRKIEISTSLSKSNEDILWDIFTTQTFVTVSIPDGVFNAVIRSVNITPGKTNITIEFESKVSI